MAQTTVNYIKSGGSLINVSHTQTDRRKRVGLGGKEHHTAYSTVHTRGDLAVVALDIQTAFVQNSHFYDIRCFIISAEALRTLITTRPPYRGANKGLYVLLSRTQAGPGRTVKQEQEEISCNHVQTFICLSVRHGSWMSCKG